MSKGGSDQTPAMPTATAPQTNALQHLIDMLNGGKAKTDDQTAGMTGPGMPIMNPQSWIKQGAGNFTPGSTSKGGMTQGAASSGGSGKGGGVGG